MKTLLTGATGFVGRALAAHLGQPFEALHLGDSDWQSHLAAADLRGATIFHLAARVHEAAATREQFEADNVAKTVALANAAAAAGARRLVFVSTIKVNGEETAGKAFTARDEPRPQGPYAESKWRAEQALAATPGLEWVIVRSPLVYGAGVGGNLRELLRMADSPWPLPFACCHNRRSFVHVDDLARLLVECSTHPSAAGATFVAAHPEPVSTSRLLATLRRQLPRRERLFCIPARVLQGAAGVAGLGARMARLTRSLEVDPAATSAALGWNAQVDLEHAAADMVHAYQGAIP
ncbi:MAG TPA: NAD-dependent epimerase/dehydratase family protein [Usitatibacter sp.]|nr:NAD-dependent epimerase/dehydratase family protein [Usitatibacter sp.]